MLYFLIYVIGAVVTGMVTLVLSKRYDLNVFPMLGTDAPDSLNSAAATILWPYYSVIVIGALIISGLAIVFDKIGDLIEKKS